MGVFVFVGVAVAGPGVLVCVGVYVGVKLFCKTANVCCASACGSDDWALFEVIHALATNIGMRKKMIRLYFCLIICSPR